MVIFRVMDNHFIDNKDYNQIYINAHGGPPFSRKSVTLDGHNYRKDNFKRYVGIVPDQTLLVLSTPPNHLFLVDNKEKIVKELINELSCRKLDFLIDNKLQDIENHQDSEKFQYISEFLNEIQIYQTGDKFYNQEILFEKTKINDIFQLSNKSYEVFQPYTRKYYGKNSYLKSYSDTRTNPDIDPILNIKKYNHYWDSFYIPYSLQGLISNIRKDIEGPLIIYFFACNPRGAPDNISYDFSNKIKSFYEKGKLTCQKYRDIYYNKNKIRKCKPINQQNISGLSKFRKDFPPFENEQLNIENVANTDWCLELRKQKKQQVERHLYEARKKRRQLRIRYSKV